jgi:hypothetical protein
MLNIITHRLRNTGEFTRRIKNRHEAFWKDPQAEKIRNTGMLRSDRLEKWADVHNWQRKLSNKHNAREFASMHNCKVPKLYWKGRDIATVNFEALPVNYVIRPTTGHCSDLVFLMRSGVNLFDNRSYTHTEIASLLHKETTKSQHVEFLFEEFLQETAGEASILSDYKIFCFNGEVACIQVINREGKNAGKASFYDSNWNRMRRITYSYKSGKTQPPPACLNEMLEKAKVLSKSYGIFVRIDFYATCDGCVFGEFTPTPSMGQNYTAFGRRLLLKYWDKYCGGLI